MSIFKRFTDERKATPAEKAGALAFKNKLKYGKNIHGMYTESRQLIRQGVEQEEYVKEKLEEIFKFKKRTISDNWTSFRISFFDECNESPIGRCLYISYYGDKSPEKDDPIHCICCKKKLF